MNKFKKNSIYFLFIAIILMLLCTSIVSHYSMQMSTNADCATHTGGFSCQILEVITTSIIPPIIGLSAVFFGLVLVNIFYHQFVNNIANLSFIVFFKRRSQNFLIISFINHFLKRGIIHPKLFQIN